MIILQKNPPFYSTFSMMVSIGNWILLLNLSLVKWERNSKWTILSKIENKIEQILFYVLKYHAWIQFTENKFSPGITSKSKNTLMMMTHICGSEQTSIISRPVDFMIGNFSRSVLMEINKLTRLSIFQVRRDQQKLMIPQT